MSGTGRVGSIGRMGSFKPTLTWHRSALVRYRLLPWWARVLLIFAAARVVTTILILILASVQGHNPWTGAHPAYFDYASIWDGNWYKIVAYNGYPSTLPVTPQGHVGENAWAFMPVYPFFVKLLMLVSGGPWTVLAVLVSLAAGFGAALVFYRLMKHVLGDSSTSMFAVVLFSVAPVSPLFQLAYAESLYTLLLVTALYLVVLRRYEWLLPVVFVMALTRPSGLAFGLFLGLHVLYRLWVRRRDPFPVGQLVAVCALGVFSVVMGLVWPLLAGVVTGVPNAYLDTELAWRSSYIGYQALVPFTAWFQSGNWWLGTPGGAVVAALLIIAFGFSLFLVSVRRIGIDLRLWVASYGLYLLAVFFPQSSTFRILMPMFPLLGAVAIPRSRAYRIAVVIGCTLAQWVWLLICWGVDGSDWTPP